MNEEGPVIPPFEQSASPAPALSGRDRPSGVSASATRLNNQLPRRRDMGHARYTRFVGLAKLILPSTAGFLILVLVGWPYLSQSLTKTEHLFPKLDGKTIKDIRMERPRYNGLDRQKRPFSITADTARQADNNDQLLALEAPKAHMQSRDGGWSIVTSQSGIYQPEAHDLDLFGKVMLFQDKGFTFTTKTARLDLSSGMAEGNDPIYGSGPSGAITGEGFRSLHGGDSILFKGKAHLTILASGHSKPAGAKKND